MDSKLKMKKLFNEAVIFPPMIEQDEIVRRVESLFSKADDLETRYREARELIETLPEIILSKAFRGKLVPQDPNDELASMILGRITAEKAKHKTERQEKKRGKGIGRS